MCVTSSPAIIGGTMAYTYAALVLHKGDSRNFHVTGYQNTAQTLEGPNCMILHFPGDEIQLVRGPEQTRHFMTDMTTNLPALQPLPPATLGRGASRGLASYAPRVEEYGAYHVVLAQHSDGILDALEEVPPHRRPRRTTQLEKLVAWYHENFEDYSFVLACFNGAVRPQHPIVVSYVAHNDDVLFVPGLEGHDGNVPIIGQPVSRNFRIAFGDQERPQPYTIRYTDENVSGQPWAPATVTGFFDNRYRSDNGDYTIGRLSVGEGLIGKELFTELIA